VYDHGHLPPFLSRELWSWRSWHIFKRKRRSALPALSMKRVKSCGGGHGLCHHVREKRGVWPSSPKRERVMTMVMLFLSSVESFGGDHG